MPESISELQALGANNEDRREQFRTLIKRLTIDGRGIIGLDLKSSIRQPSIYEIVFDYGREHWRAYVGDVPLEARHVLLLMVVRKPGGSRGLPIQDRHMDEAAERRRRWLVAAGYTPTGALASTQVDPVRDDA